ncbi:MAG: cyclodeaminase/cyclohydrolase family protein [Candidatus Eremiobacteraeota bacterium]|nr:cyclodeaminase/cyclohydrolase family protein [Candidatus Eremiobacteraeota bacterium]
MTLTALSLEAFSRKLASADPTPGGGSVAAAVGAFGAGLIRMVAQLTRNSPKFASVADMCGDIAERAQRLLATLLRLVDDDAASFDAVSAAYGMPKASDTEKQARSAAVQRALGGAIDPPMRVIACAREICDLAVELIDVANPNALSDIGCAALCAQTASQAAALNVEINASMLKDRSAAQAHVEVLNAGLAHVSLLAEIVLGKVRSRVENKL